MTDLILRDGWIVDGTGREGYRGSVVIDRGRIVDVGDVDGRSASDEIDSGGLVIAPGFIDLHTHSDFSLPAHPRADSMTRQGVTTQVLGNCGFSAFPVRDEHRSLVESWSSFFGGDADWLRPDAASFGHYLETLPLACNVALQVGHGTVRIAAMGFEDRAPTPAEIIDMQGLVAEAIDQGAVGLSTGLLYPPGSFSDTSELIDLAAVLRGLGAFYASHVRGEADTLLPAVSEALEIGRESMVPVHLSHHKAQGRRNWGGVKGSLELVDRAISSGHDVTLDVYPYAAGCTTLTAILPEWAMDGGIPALMRRLADEGTRARIEHELALVANAAGAWNGFDVATIEISSVPEGPNKGLEQLLLTEVAAQHNEDPASTALRLIEEEDGNVQIITFSMAEEDVDRVIQHRASAIASDGWILSPETPGTPHPRNYGTFARVLGTYVRERGVLGLEEAVRKMTMLPARRLGRTDIGRIDIGAAADVVVFDPTSVADRATYAKPKQFCAGVQHVAVNGRLVIRDGRDTGTPAGRLIRRGRD